MCRGKVRFKRCHTLLLPGTEIFWKVRKETSFLCFVVSSVWYSPLSSGSLFPEGNHDHWWWTKTQDAETTTNVLILTLNENPLNTSLEASLGELGFLKQYLCLLRAWKVNSKEEAQIRRRRVAGGPESSMKWEEELLIGQQKGGRVKIPWACADYSTFTHIQRVIYRVWDFLSRKLIDY